MASVAIEFKGKDGENSKNRDEIDKFVTSRFITASESVWRICGFDVHGRDPSIQ